MEELGKKIDAISNQLTQLRMEIWTKYTLFTWQWWSFVAVCVISTALFIWLIKRKSLLQTLTYFGIIYILNRNLDDAATSFDWYDYRMQLEPIIPTFLPANLFVIPMALAILYQRYRKWSSFIIANVIFSAFTAFCVLPLAKAGKIYLPKSWTYITSFIVLIIMAIISKMVVDKLKDIQEKPETKK